MSNKQRLLDLYTEDERTKSIIKTLTSSVPGRLNLSGMVGAQESFVLSGTFLCHPASHVFVAIDKEEAAYMQNTLSNLLEGQTIHFFPDSFKRPMAYEELNNHNILQRTEAVNKINLKNGEKQILITYPEALFEKVVDPKLLNENKIIISVSESVDVDTMIEILVDYAFERVDFVYEPGQFAIRGGIVDVFTYGNEWPYRIELFDDEVESIRTFDPTTQLSVRKLSKVSIIPNINSKFKQEQKVSLFKVFGKETTIWIKDADVLLDKLQMCFEKVEDYSKNIVVKSDEELKSIFDDRAFIFPNDVLGEISDYNVILLRKSTLPLEGITEIEYNTAPQPSFNKNFNLLIEHLEGNTKQNIENYLFTDSTKQIERFYNIFEDLQADVNFHPVEKAIHAGFLDQNLKIACYTDHQIFERFHRFKLRRGFTKEQALNLKMLRELQPGDFVTHIDHGVGRYSGLEKIDINGHIQESVRIFYLNNDVLYVGISSLHKISKYIGKEGATPRLSKLGSDTWKSLKRKTKRKVKDIAKQLIKLYAKRKASKGFAFPADGYMQNELEASFIYQDTPDQEKATEAVKEDMMKTSPMDRLICGDVGFGKTEVAIRAAFKAVIAGKQVGILVPTTILALQHFHTFNNRLKEFGVTVDYVNRFRSTKEKTQLYKDLESGKVEIVIGTHALLNKKVKFKDLGLLVIDEEQKFGVAAKEKLREMAVNVDTLTLTATPIPRTLQFSLMAARDLSIIKTPPPNRQPIHTERRLFNDSIIKESIYYEINRGGQVFFVHNRVKNLMDIAAMVKRLCPDVTVAMAHGQMEAKTLEKTLLNFIEGQYDVLVCTNIIETGLDIPNANTIIINNAHHFGMSDLHQLRGRVGRSNKKAYCYLFTPPISVLTAEARKRIRTLEEFSDLGSGFHIAMRDLDIRGAGNLLGGEQSGFISEIGYETYQKILEEAIIELKETDFKELFKDQMQKDHTFVRDVEIDTDAEMLIPDAYISTIQERLNLYRELDEIENEEALSTFRKNMIDRFGPIPEEVETLFHGLRLRWLCKELGFERLSLKSNKLRCFFIRNPQSAFFETPIFQKIMAFISTKGNDYQMSLKHTQSHLILIKENVKNMKEARINLQNMLDDLE